MYNAKRFSVGAHVVIKYGGVPSPQHIAPTKFVYNAKRFSVGAHVVIKYAGVPPPQRIAPTKPVYNAKRFGVGRMSSSNMSVCRPRMPLR
ncbi:hypothetical protein ACQJ22_23385 [Pseudomonas fragariae (ex Marin et al. 2024)]|uniref:hypothetical protein n=1 Tax=Pseudomonas TaxID=286 RepID=UPI000448D317|nr:hypothetical protein [Pseudomonas syringae]AKF43964.1 hypothetical protein PsyrB_02085 [Pseudomonas syringae pv. syringae B301D]EXL31346.1 hypothetical protein PssB301D_02401 [Pseudomonas syringae pv. syringae str. B301D-R]